MIVSSCEIPYMAVDPAREDELFVVPPEIAEAVRKVGLSVEDAFFVVRPMASVQRQSGLEYR